MAVTTWTAGQVLTAADLNDTLASKLPYSYGTATPSTTDSGYLWYDSNSTPPVPKYWNGSSFATLAPAPGLELITSESFSAVSSVSVNSCFTSTYDRYRILIRGVSSAGSDQRLRLRVSGSDNTSNNYGWGRFTARTGSTTADSTTGYGDFALLGFASTAAYNISIDIMSPALVQTTHYNAIGHFADGTNNNVSIASGHTSVTTAYDGFTLYANTGTFTGTLSIYGYKD